MGLVTTVHSITGQLEVKCLSMTTHTDNITSKMPQLCEIDRVAQYTRQPPDWIVDYISPIPKFTQPGHRTFDILTSHVA